MSFDERNPRVWLKRAAVLFGAWSLLLINGLLFEHTVFAKFVFSHAVTAFTYLGLQLLVHAAALAACVMTFVRGSTPHRFIVFLPTIVLVVYSLVLIGGPG